LSIRLGSKPPLVTRIARTGLGTRLHKIQVILKKQGDHTKANKSGEEAQKETMGLIDIGLPQSKKIKVNSNSKARIEGKIQ